VWKFVVNFVICFPLQYQSGIIIILLDKWQKWNAGYLTALQSPAPGDRPTVHPHWLCYTRRRLWSRSVIAISCYRTTNWLPLTWDTVRPGRSTPADLVQSRSSQTGPRSVSELESVLTLNTIGYVSQRGSHSDRGCQSATLKWFIGVLCPGGLMVRAFHL